MESVIKWHTGEPKEVGEYLITCSDGIHIDNYCEYECEQGDFYDWERFTDDMILAWCPLSEIEPYKDKIMANLAIKGHATRGKEVIEILEMLGGKIRYDRLAGNELFSWYYINGNGYIDYKHYSLFDDTTVFTIEEFLKKFPYKVGDKVKYRNNIFYIKSSQWDSEKNTVIYYIDADWSAGYVVETDNLQPYKEETMDKVNKSVFDANAQCCDIMNRLIKEETMEEEEENFGECIEKEIQECLFGKQETTEEIKVDIPKGYEFAGVDDDKQQIVFTKIQPQYPKTYEECCEILSIPSYYKLKYSTYEHGYHEYTTSKKLGLLQDKLNTLGKLLICRNAYWKLYGEEKGLGKLWEPDYDSGVNKFGIICLNGVIQKSNPTTNWERHLNKNLDFPTEEMRDAFYENFKDMINQCKELL